MKKSMILCFLPLFLAVSAVMAETGKTFSGFLCDTLCYTNEGHIALDGTDMSKNPEKHEVGCLKNEPCIASGYGILIKNDSGAYDFTRFDDYGNKLVKAMLKATKRTSNFYIRVKGIMVKDIIKVWKINEAESTAMTTAGSMSPMVMK